MSRSKLLAYGTLCMCFCGLVLADSAWSAPTVACSPNGGTKEVSMLCIENTAKELLVLGLPAEEMIEVLAVKEPSTVFALNTPSVGLEVECMTASAVGKAVGLPVLSAEFTSLIVKFKECIVVTKEELCEVEGLPGKTPKELETVALVADVTNPKTEDGDLTFKPASGGAVITEMNVKSIPGKICPIAIIKARLEGEPLALLLTPEAAEVTHLLDFEKAGNLLLGGGPSELTLTEEVKLDSTFTGFPANPQWSLRLTETVS